MGNFFLKRHALVFKSISVLLIFFFCSSFILRDVYALLDTGTGIYGINPVDVGYDDYVNLDVDTFVLPAHLGEIKYSYKGDPDKVIVHIQDAHCNVFAQNKIADIIDFLNREYGIKMINLEGGAGEYDLSIFTSITNETIRREVAQYFVKSGKINGAEFYAINNPLAVNLWGVENKDIYLENLKVYRDSLVYREEVDGYLKELTHILNNLKRHIYNRELLDLDIAYTTYKAGNGEFKDYVDFLIGKTKKYGIPITAFKNLYHLSQVIKMEDGIDFARANKERDIIIETLNKRLSPNEQKKLLSNTFDLKTRKISRKTFYAFLVEKIGETGLDLGRYPELSKYVEYVSIYGSVDKSKVMDELADIEKDLKEKLFQNNEQRQMSLFSKNLALTKNIFEICCSRNDYKYYLDNEDFFNVCHYRDFIEKEAPKFRITAELDEQISKMDEYRRDIVRFYECSFERDRAFLRNIQYNAVPGGQKSAFLITGGFHTENLCELLEDNKISYISIMPKFTSEEGYENPYFDLLAGSSTGVQRVLTSILAKATMIQIASMLSQELGEDVWGTSNLKAFKALVIIQEEVIRNGKELQGIRSKEEDNEVILVFQWNDGTEDEMYLKSLLDTIHQRFTDGQMEKLSANDPGAFRDIEDIDGIIADISDFMRSIGADQEVLDRVEELRTKTNMKGEALVRSVRGIDFEGHAGGRGIRINDNLSGKDREAVIIHEIIAGIYGDHRIASAVEDAFRNKRRSESILAGQRSLEKPVWAMSAWERFDVADKRDFERDREAAEPKPWRAVGIGPREQDRKTLEDIGRALNENKRVENIEDIQIYIPETFSPDRVLDLKKALDLLYELVKEDALDRKAMDVPGTDMHNKYIEPYSRNDNLRIEADSGDIKELKEYMLRENVAFYIVPGNSIGASEMKTKQSSFDENQGYYSNFKKHKDIVVQGKNVFITERLINAIFNDYRRWLDTLTELNIAEDRGVVEWILDKYNVKSFGSIEIKEFRAQMEKETKKLLKRYRTPARQKMSELDKKAAKKLLKINKRGEYFVNLLRKVKKREAYTPERILLASLLHSIAVIRNTKAGSMQREKTFMGRLDRANIAEKVWGGQMEVVPVKEKVEKDKTEALPMEKKPEPEPMIVNITLVNANPKLERMARRLARDKFERLMSDKLMGIARTDENGKLVIREIKLPGILKIFAGLWNRMIRYSLVNNLEDYYRRILKEIVGEGDARGRREITAPEDFELKRELLRGVAAGESTGENIEEMILRFDDTDKGPLASLANRRQVLDNYEKGLDDKSISTDLFKTAGLSEEEELRAREEAEGIKKEIDTTVNEYVYNNQTSDVDFEKNIFDIRNKIRNYINNFRPEIDERIAFLGANFLSQAKFARRAWQERVEGAEKVPIKINVNFNESPGSVDVNTEVGPRTFYEKLMVRIINKVQNTRWIRGLSSPLFTTVLVNIIFNTGMLAFLIFFRKGAVDMFNVIAPVAGGPYISILVVSIITAGVLTFIRARAEILQKKEVAEAREKLGDLGKTGFDSKIQEYLRGKLDVLQIVSSLNNIKSSYTKSEEIKKAIKNNSVPSEVAGKALSLEEAIGQVLFYLDGGDLLIKEGRKIISDTIQQEDLSQGTKEERLMVGNELIERGELLKQNDFLKYDKSQEIETATGEMISLIYWALEELSGVRTKLDVEQEDYANKRNQIVEQQKNIMLSTARERFFTEEKDAILKDKEFSRFKLWENLKSASIAMLVAGAVSFIIMELFNFLRDIFVPEAEDTVVETVSKEVEKEISDPGKFRELMNSLAGKVDVEDFSAYLNRKGFNNAPEIAERLLSGDSAGNTLSNEMVNTNQPGLAIAIEDYFRDKFDVTMAFKDWNDPAFIKKFWDSSPEIAKSVSGIIGEDNIEEFYNAFEQEMKTAEKGEITFYDTLGDVLKKYPGTGNADTKALETVILDGIWKSSEIRANLEDIFIENGFLRSNESLVVFFEGHEDWGSTLERYRRYVTNRTEFDEFSNEAKKLYNAAKSSDTAEAWEKVRDFLKTALLSRDGIPGIDMPPHDKMNIVFDWIHRFDLFRDKTSPTGAFKTTFFLWQREVLTIRMVETITEEIAKTAENAAEAIQRIFPGTAEVPYGAFESPDSREEQKANFIGKVFDSSGNLIERGIQAEEVDIAGKKTLRVKHNGMNLADLPLSGETISSDDFSDLLNDLGQKRSRLPADMMAGFNDLFNQLQRMKGDREVMLLEHSPENADIQGLYGNDKVYLNEFLAKNLMALLHETGEGSVPLPAGYNDLSRHTMMRGVGKDLRNALNRLFPDGRVPITLPAESVMAMVEEEMELMASEGFISDTRTKMKAEGKQVSLITASEKDLIKYNSSMGRKGKALFYGMQDFLDPAGNIAFTSELRILRDDLRRGTLDYFIIPSSVVTEKTQEEYSKKTGRKFRKRGINTRVTHYEHSNFTDLKERLDKVLAEASLKINTVKIPKIFIDVLKESGLKSRLDRYIESLPEEQRSMIILAEDTTEMKKGSGIPVTVDDVKIITVGSAILNDNRLRVNFGLSPERLSENRARMLTAFRNSGILDIALSELYTADGKTRVDNIEAIMQSLYLGNIPLKISPIRWEDLRDYHDSMAEVLRSL